MFRKIGIWLVAMFAGAAFAAESVGQLKSYYESVDALEGRFEQVVRNEAGDVVERSTGSMAIKRPGQFRWDYEEPFPQVIVGDGEQLWVYDEELEQVTVRPLEDVIGVGPALLLSGDYDSLEESFRIEELGDGWLRLIPRSGDWDFQAIRLRMDDGVPRTVEVDDGLGQVTRLELLDLSRNPELSAERFRFVPPKGVDVIRPGAAEEG